MLGGSSVNGASVGTPREAQSQFSVISILDPHRRLTILRGELAHFTGRYHSLLLLAFFLFLTLFANFFSPLVSLQSKPFFFLIYSIDGCQAAGLMLLEHKDFCSAPCSDIPAPFLLFFKHLNKVTDEREQRQPVLLPSTVRRSTCFSSR